MASLPRSEDSNLPTNDTTEDTEQPKPLTKYQQRKERARLIEDIDEAVRDMAYSLWEGVIRPLMRDPDPDAVIRIAGEYRGEAWLKAHNFMEAYKALQEGGYEMYLLSGRIRKNTRRKPTKTE